MTGEASVASAWRLTAALYVLAMVPTWWIVVPAIPASRAGARARLDHQCFFLFLRRPPRDAGLLRAAFGRTKRLGVWANVTIAIPRGTLLKVAGWTLVASAFSAEPWAIGGLFGLFLLGAASTKDFSDADGDRAGGCETLPVNVREPEGRRDDLAVLRRAVAPPRDPRLGTRPSRPVPAGSSTGNPVLLRRSGSASRPGVRTPCASWAQSGRARDDGEPSVLDAHVSHAHVRAGGLRARIRFLNHSAGVRWYRGRACPHGPVADLPALTIRWEGLVVAIDATTLNTFARQRHPPGQGDPRGPRSTPRTGRLGSTVRARRASPWRSAARSATCASRTASSGSRSPS